MSIVTLELKAFLDLKSGEYNTPDFIGEDPISIPHRYSCKEDREIAAFLAASISWGQRSTIVRNAGRLMDLMEDMPYRFLVEADEREFTRFQSFVHRTFNGDDCLFFLQALRTLYKDHGGLEDIFAKGFHESGEIFVAIRQFREAMLQTPHLGRSGKHLPDPDKGSACKRTNMFLRWMVRKDNTGVDLGIWNSIPPAALMCPLDVHSANIARKLGLLSRKQNDRKAVEELTGNLRKFDPDDPVKYDFALFGIGIFEKK